LALAGWHGLGDTASPLDLHPVVGQEKLCSSTGGQEILPCGQSLPKLSSHLQENAAYLANSLADDDDDDPIPLTNGSIVLPVLSQLTSTWCNSWPSLPEIFASNCSRAPPA
jgi:hypothetical protein